MKEFWEKANSLNQQPDAEKQEPSAEISKKDAGSEEMRALYEASILGQSQSEQAFGKPSRTTQEHLTISSKEIVRCISDTLTEISHSCEAAHAPLGVASPQSVGGVSEKEEDSPTTNDCTSLALVDAAQSNSASLLAENQDCGVEAAVFHEGTCSAAPVAQNEKSLNSAMSNDKPFHVYANQRQGEVEQGYSATLLVENSVPGVEIKAVDEGESSAPSVVNSEKWSHEAIVARSNLRPERMQKLKLAANSGQNPGFQFLQECWNDDPALQIVIKKLLVKFSQWGIAIVDGMLLNWEE
ncbi:hypothetical protein [Nostoc sp. MG11]|uniref:hypothetical protein n=1 Tax=Nostoc sp. MG11 TaxID=2721166 RepID=UPI001D015575|nr:hypothetical protein [Nostoc sp. MG11]